MGQVPVASLPAIQADAGAKRDWLAQVARYGFGKLTHGPLHDGALFEVVDLFGYVRETNYGRKFEAVSYTHLDVYKRQDPFCPALPGTRQRDAGLLAPIALR